MFLPLFVPCVPVSVRTRRSHLSSRRPRVLVCSATSSNSEKDPKDIDLNKSSNETGDPAWIKMAQSLGSESAQDNVPRPPPQWTYPDGDPRDVGDENPWNAWNAAISSEQEIRPRDPKAETDFWRSTARDMVKNNNTSSETKTSGNRTGGGSFEKLSQDVSDLDDVTSSKQMWEMARGITGEMTSLQSQLREELDRYDPEHNRDQYRDIARELVGPPDDEPWEGDDPVRSQDKTEAGSGWNPDVDWMRFDDVGREKALAEEAARRRSVEDASRQSMLNSLENTNTSDINNKAENETVEGDSLLGIPFDSKDDVVTVDGKVPNFIANRFRSGSTYGGGWSGAEREMERLQAQGIELRDPTSDTNQWRSAAKELNAELTNSGIKTEDADKSSVDSVSKETNAGNIGSLNDGTQTDGYTDNGNEASVWSSWRSGNATWERANEKVEARDPKKEVDMWRSSARDLLSSKDLETSESNVNKGSSAESTEESSVWAQWRNANARWEKGVLSSDADPGESFRGSPSNLDTGKVDWGAGLGKTNSERSAWDNWNRVGVQTSGDDATMWWNTRLDGSVSMGGRDSPANTPLVNDEKKLTGDRKERLEKDSSINPWRSFAKEIIPETDSNDETS